MLAVRPCFLALLQVALLRAMRPGTKFDVKEDVMLIGPGIPLFDYHLAYEGRSLTKLSGADVDQAHWMVFLDQGTTAAEVRRLCDSTQGCEMEGFSTEQDMRFLQLLGTEQDLTTLVSRAGSQIRFVRAGSFQMEQSSALVEQDRKTEGPEAEEPVATEDSTSPTLRDMIAHTRATNGIRSELFGGPEDYSVALSAAFVVIFIAIAMTINVLETFYKAAHDVTTGRLKHSIFTVIAQSMRPVVAVSAFFVHTACLYDVVLVRNMGHLQDRTVEILMFMSFAWWFVTFLWEVFVNKPRICAHKDDFVACDVFTDLTDSMFNVTVRFLTQASMMVILVQVIKEQVALGAPTGLEPVRIVVNFCIALILELYLFVVSRGQSKWEDLRRLQSVVAVAHLDPVTNSDNSPKLVTSVSRADYHLRFGMSIMVTGIFHKFLILAYPVLVFTVFARDDWITILKDILAITIVVELDNLARPMPFITLTREECRLADGSSHDLGDLGTVSTAACLNMSHLREDDDEDDAED